MDGYSYSCLVTCVSRPSLWTLVHVTCGSNSGSGAARTRSTPNNDGAVAEEEGEEREPRRGSPAIPSRKGALGAALPASTPAAQPRVSSSGKSSSRVQLRVSAAGKSSRGGESRPSDSSPPPWPPSPGEGPAEGAAATPRTCSPRAARSGAPLSSGSLYRGGSGQCYVGIKL